MARVLMVPQETSDVGTDISMNVVSEDGHEFRWDPRCVLVVRNRNEEGAITVTIETPRTVRGLEIADRMVLIAAGTMRYIGPFMSFYRHPTTGMVKVDLNFVANVDAALIRVP